MRLSRHCVIMAGLAAVAVAFSTPASAQTIHHYGDSGSQSSGGGQTSSGSNGGGGQAWYPGMPVPQQSSDQGNAQAAGKAQGSGQAGSEQGGEGGEGEGEEAATPSHRITIFSGQHKSADGPRTTLDLALDQLYRGVIPGTRDSVSHLEKAREEGADSGHANELTWLGFRPTDEHTRVFFQTARKADYRIRRKQDPAVIEIEIEDTKIPAKNFSRFIDTSYFGRNVKRVNAEKTGPNTVEITIELGTFEQPTVRQDGTYVYLDFPYSAPDKDKAQDNAKVAGQQDQPQP